MCCWYFLVFLTRAQVRRALTCTSLGDRALLDCTNRRFVKKGPRRCCLWHARVPSALLSRALRACTYPEPCTHLRWSARHGVSKEATFGERRARGALGARALTFGEVLGQRRWVHVASLLTPCEHSRALRALRASKKQEGEKCTPCFACKITGVSIARTYPCFACKITGVSKKARAQAQALFACTSTYVHPLFCLQNKEELVLLCFFEARRSTSHLLACTYVLVLTPKRGK